MNKTTKHIIIGGGIFVGLGLTAYLLYQLVYVPNQKEKEEEQRKKRLEAQRVYADTEEGNPENGGYRFNVEGELDYPSMELIGKMMYPKPTSLGGLGYAWVRSSALVDNGGWDFWSNKITKAASGKKIGKVVDYKKGDESGYAYTWFKVKIDNGLGVSDTYGWVRSDAVIFKDY